MTCKYFIFLYLNFVILIIFVFSFFTIIASILIILVAIVSSQKNVYFFIHIQIFNNNIRFDSIICRSRTLPDELKLNFQCSGVGEIVCSSTQGGVVTSGGGFSNSNIRERDVSFCLLRLWDIAFCRIIPHILSYIIFSPHTDKYMCSGRHIFYLSLIHTYTQLHSVSILPPLTLSLLNTRVHTVSLPFSHSLSPTLSLSPLLSLFFYSSSISFSLSPTHAGTMAESSSGCLSRAITIAAIPAHSEDHPFPT